MIRSTLVLLTTIIITLTVLTSTTTPALAAPDAKKKAASKDPFHGYSTAAREAVDRMIRAVRKLDTYQDKAVYSFDTDASGMGMAPPDIKVHLTMARGGKFRLETDQHEVVSDGKQLNIYSRQLKRYQQKTIKPKELEQQLKDFMSGVPGMIDFGVLQLMVASKPQNTFGERFKNLQVGQNVMLDGEDCYRLEGEVSFDAMGQSAQAPVTLLLRRRDHMLRRVEVDLKPLYEKQMENMPEEFAQKIERYLLIYDVVDLKINEPLDKSIFSFDPPEAAKKVDKFYSTFPTASGTAEQFELSGQPAPSFELETASGDMLTPDDFKGAVLVLMFYPAYAGNYPGQYDQLKALQKISDAYVQKDANFLLVLSGQEIDKTTEKLTEEDIFLPILKDPQGTMTQKYCRDYYSSGVVLIGKDGKVQGRYLHLASEATQKALKKDVDKLLKGKTLPGGEPMTEEQIYEAAEQRSARFVMDTAEALNEKRLIQRWKVRTRDSSNNMYFSSNGTGSARRSRAANAMWIRDGRKLKGVDPQGKVVGTIELPGTPTPQYQQPEIVVGEINRRLAAVTIIPPKNNPYVSYGGSEPPAEPDPEDMKSFLVAIGESGKELWRLDVTSKQPYFNGMPSQLAMLDLDSRPGDEVIFVHQSAIWIVNGEGEVMCRKPFVGQVAWLNAADKDGDRRIELYLRTSTKLVRFDYDGRN